MVIVRCMWCCSVNFNEKRSLWRDNKEWIFGFVVPNAVRKLTEQMIQIILNINKFVHNFKLYKFVINLVH